MWNKVELSKMLRFKKFFRKIKHEESTHSIGYPHDISDGLKPESTAESNEIKLLKNKAAAEAKRIAAFSNSSIKRAGLLFRAGKYQRAEEVLRCVDQVCISETRHLNTFGNVLAAQDFFVEAETVFRRLIEEDKTAIRPVVRLADVLSGQGRHADAADVLQKFIDSTGPDSNLKRRIQTHRNIAGVPNEETFVKRSEALEIHKDAPELSAMQKKVLTDLQSTGIAITSFDELFGGSALWKEAESEFAKFAGDERVKSLGDKISKTTDFASDAELSKLFKPSIVNYKNFFGDLTPESPVVKLYVADEILGIANAYNGMVSKIRNMHMWVNPPLHVDNVNGRKGSQLWHRDQEDSRILKCFIYFSDIDEDSGATDYVKNTAVDSAGLKDAVIPYPSSSGYPLEEQFYSRVPVENFVRADGKKGTIVFLDTNGFHRGGFVKKNARHIAMCTFLRPISPYVEMNTKVNVSCGLDKGLGAAAIYGLS